MKIEKIYFNKEEANILAMGLASIIEDLKPGVSGDLALKPWTPEARQYFKDMMKHAKSAANKLEKFAGVKCSLPEYNDGDEQEFFTKES